MKAAFPLLLVVSMAAFLVSGCAKHRSAGFAITKETATKIALEDQLSRHSKFFPYPRVTHAEQLPNGNWLISVTLDPNVPGAHNTIEVVGTNGHIVSRHGGS